jgi:hypothetical protein
MQVQIKELLDSADLKEPLYPGKKLVKKYAVPGQFKSHCVVFDWRVSDTLRVELKAGQSGRTLDPIELKNFPVSFQAPTYLDLKVDNDNIEDEEDEDEGSARSGKGGGGKKPKKKKTLAGGAFERVMDGKVPSLAQIEKFVVMGKELAQEQFAKAFENLKEQLHQSKVMVMDLMKDVGDVIKRATPGGGLNAKGNETLKYKYDVEKTGPMFGAAGPS